MKEFSFFDFTHGMRDGVHSVVVEENRLLQQLLLLLLLMLLDSQFTEEVKQSKNLQSS